MADWTQRYYEQAYELLWGLGPPNEQHLAESAWFSEALSVPKRRWILDLACGHGRYALGLASLDHLVVGIDASPRLLGMAARHSLELTVPPRLVMGDMRRLPVRGVGGAILLDGFGFFDDESQNAQVLVQLSEALLPPGRLILAVANAVPILTRFREKEEKLVRGRAVKIARDLEGSQMVEEIELEHDGTVTHFTRRQRLYDVEDLSRFLRKARFDVLAVYSNYLGGEFDHETSGKIVVLAEV